MSEQILKKVHDSKINHIRLWFVDIMGQLKGFVISKRELETAFADGMGFDGSSIEGFARIHESDLLAYPDPSTFTMMPFTDDEFPSAMMFCDLKTPDNEPFAGDSRFILRSNLKKAKDRGYDFYIGPELEYFYFKNSHDNTPLDHNGYFDASISEVGPTLRKRSIDYLENMGIKVEYSHHEVANSQHEIDLRYDEALKMADKCITYKFIIKEVARREGYFATFMPKPVYGVNGSGMHVHQSLFKDNKNAFCDFEAPFNLSKTARSYLAGLLKYAGEITSVLNQTINSYKRLVPGHEAPVYVTWGRQNRSALIRVPQVRRGKESSIRLELRSPDPAANPYLAFSVMLAAGLKGIEENLEPPEPVERDLFNSHTNGIETLPELLSEAIQLTKKSELVREALGEHMFNKFIENKIIEYQMFRKQVTDYELNKYLPIL